LVVHVHEADADEIVVGRVGKGQAAQVVGDVGQGVWVRTKTREDGK
jgi:hypothetical protein